MRSVPDEPDFSVEVGAAPDGRRTRIAVIGEIDISTADELGRTIEEALRTAPVLLDLEGVRFMDSSGIRMLDAVLRHVDRFDGDLLVSPRLSENVRQLLALTGMLDVLPYADEPDQRAPR